MQPLSLEPLGALLRDGLQLGLHRLVQVSSRGDGQLIIHTAVPPAALGTQQRRLDDDLRDSGDVAQLQQILHASVDREAGERGKRREEGRRLNGRF